MSITPLYLFQFDITKCKGNAIEKTFSIVLKSSMLNHRITKQPRNIHMHVIVLQIEIMQPEEAIGKRTS